MEIIVNGDARQVADGLTVAALVQALGLEGKRLAVEVNMDIVPRSLHVDHQLQAGDKVEVVHAIGGG